MFIVADGSASFLPHPHFYVNLGKFVETKKIIHYRKLRLRIKICVRILSKIGSAIIKIFGSGSTFVFGGGVFILENLLVNRL